VGQDVVGAARRVVIDAHAGQRIGAARVDRDREGAALDRAADPGRDRILGRRREADAAHLEIDVAMVDRADIDGRTRAGVLGDAPPETGHAAHRG